MIKILAVILGVYCLIFAPIFEVVGLENWTDAIIDILSSIGLGVLFLYFGLTGENITEKPIRKMIRKILGEKTE